MGSKKKRHDWEGPKRGAATGKKSSKRDLRGPLHKIIEKKRKGGSKKKTATGRCSMKSRTACLLKKSGKWGKKMWGKKNFGENAKRQNQNMKKKGGGQNAILSDEKGVGCPVEKSGRARGEKTFTTRDWI